MTERSLRPNYDIVTTPTQPQLNSKVGCDTKMTTTTTTHHHHQKLNVINISAVPDPIYQHNHNHHRLLHEIFVPAK